MRKYPWAIAGILVGIFTITAACNHSDNNSASSKHPIVKWFQGEPGATQNVNNAVDRLQASGWDQELLALSDQLMDDYAATISTLEYETYTEGRLLPLNHLPNKFIPVQLK